MANCSYAKTFNVLYVKYDVMVMLCLLYIKILATLGILQLAIGIHPYLIKQSLPNDWQAMSYMICATLHNLNILGG